MYESVKRIAGFYSETTLAGEMKKIFVPKEIFKLDRRKLLTSAKFTVPAIRLFEELPRNPVITLKQVVELLDTTKPEGKAIGALVKVGILQEITGGKRNRLFRNSKYIGLLG